MALVLALVAAGALFVRASGILGSGTVETAAAPSPLVLGAQPVPGESGAESRDPSVTARGAPDVRLRIRSHPDGARVRVTWPDGTTTSGRTPFRRMVPGGAVTLELRLRGHNRLVQDTVLDRNATFDLWLDPRGQLLHKLGTLASGGAPKQVAFSPDGAEVWVTTLGGPGAEVFDVRTMKRIAVVDLGGSGVEVVFNGDGSRVYVSQMETASVFEIDRASRTVVRQLRGSGSWSKVIALSPNERRLYLANWVSDDVSEFNLRTGREVRRIPTVDTPRGLYISPDGRDLYVAGFGGGEIQRIGLRSGSTELLLRTGGAIRHFAADPERGLLYADDMSTNEVFVVDLAAGAARKVADTNHRPNTIDVSPDGRVLFVSNRGRDNPLTYYIPGPEWGSVLVLDTATGRVLDAIVGGNQTTGLDVSPDGTMLAFSDLLDNTITLYAIPPYDVLASGDGGRARSHLADLQK